MSCDWNVHCLDCNETETYCDANHRRDLMEKLIEYAAAISAIAPLLAESGGDVELKTSYGYIDASWFARHSGHRLVPIDEYGILAGQCRNRTMNGENCRLDDGHEGTCTVWRMDRQ